jgi:6-phosphogluconolactonase (cycloisomerase 2 family)
LRIIAEFTGSITQIKLKKNGAILHRIEVVTQQRTGGREQQPIPHHPAICIQHTTSDVWIQPEFTVLVHMQSIIALQ